MQPLPIHSNFTTNRLAMPMNTRTPNKSRAFTWIEALMILAVLLLLAAVMLPMLARPHRPHRTSCVNHLKQVQLAFKVWAGDQNELSPMQVSITNGGAMEWAATGDVFRVFQVMSNEFTPKILICPNETDPARTIATTFDTIIPRGIPDQVPFTGNSNTSYFVGLDALDIYPQMFLTGDRNLATNGFPVKPGVLTITNAFDVSWTREMHVNQGNIGLADGSVQSWNTPALKAALATTGTNITRLGMP